MGQLCTCDTSWQACPRHTMPYVKKEKPMQKFVVKYHLPSTNTGFYAEVSATNAEQAVAIFSRDLAGAIPTQVFKLEADVERTYTVKPIGSN